MSTAIDPHHPEPEDDAPDEVHDIGTDEPQSEEPPTDGVGTDEPGPDEPDPDEVDPDEVGTDEFGTDEPSDTTPVVRFDCTGPAASWADGAEAARAAVEQGECVVLPTDTVYGIGADAFNGDAVQRLLDAKRRGRDMPPPVLIGDPSLIRALATDVPEQAKELIAKHWPGPLTVICKIQPSLRMDLGETAGTIALRVPDHEVTREVLRRTGPLAVSSANLSGRPAALTCDDAVEQLGHEVSVYLDGGPLSANGGAASTIVDFTQRDEGEVLRHGALTLAVLQETLPDLVDLVEPPAPEEPAETSTEPDEPAETGAEPEASDDHPVAAEPDPEQDAEAAPPTVRDDPTPPPGA